MTDNPYTFTEQTSESQLGFTTVTATATSDDGTSTSTEMHVPTSLIDNDGVRDNVHNTLAYRLRTAE